MSPVTDSIKKSFVSTPKVASLNRSNYMQHTEKEYIWLNYIREALTNEYETLNNISWAAYHASSEP